MDMARPQQLIHTSERVLAPDTRAKAVALCGKVPLEDGFDDHAQRRLHHAVLNSRYPQWALLLASRLRDVVPPDRLRTVRAGSQGLAQAAQVGVQVLRIQFDVDMVHPGRALVGSHRSERRPQRGFRVELVDQTIPSASCDPFGQGRQHPCRPYRRFGR
jgi:hypothetical protein